jgi:putative hydrolase of the HAD superfamily
MLTQMASRLLVNKADFAKMWRGTADNRMIGVFQSYEICIREICRKLGVTVTDIQVNSAANLRTEQASLEVKLHDGSIDVLSKLKIQGYRTGLISNLSFMGVKFWKASLLAPLVDVAVLSCVEHMKKPDPRIFLTACERLKVKPEACIYIADGMDNELEAAASIGMAPVLIRHPGVPVSPDGSSWHGPVISSLNEVLELL